MKNRRLKELVYVAMSCALICVCAWITVPTPIPFTMQTFAILTISYFLGAKAGTLSVLIYLLLGAVGLPVFSGFQGGLGYLLGPVGGYLFGFVICAALVGLLSKTKLPSYASMALGILCCYAAGTVWYAVTYGGGEGIWQIICLCVVPYIFPDCAKAALSVLVVRRLKRSNLAK